MGFDGKVESAPVSRSKGCGRQRVAANGRPVNARRISSELRMAGLFADRTRELERLVTSLNHTTRNACAPAAQRSRLVCIIIATGMDH
jgi:hypothetical protein